MENKDNLESLIWPNCEIIDNNDTIDFITYINIKQVDNKKHLIAVRHSDKKSNTYDAYKDFMILIHDALNIPIEDVDYICENEKEPYLTII